MKAGSAISPFHWDRSIASVLFSLFCLLLSSCAGLPAQAPLATTLLPTDRPAATAVPLRPTLLPSTPTYPSTPTLSPTPASTGTLALPPHPGIFARPGVPRELVAQVLLPVGWQWVSAQQLAAVTVTLGGSETRWVYALAAPFPTVADDISLQDLRRAWLGERLAQGGGAPLLLEVDTLAAMSDLLGSPADGAVRVVGWDDLLSLAWSTHAWAILPFERLEPRWKVISLDGVSPLQRGELLNYPLVAGFHLEGPGQEQFRSGLGRLPAANRDPERLTTLLMTGTTALVRAVGYKMETHGMEYPGEAIRAWLQNADFTHISNESSFNPGCPDANPNSRSLMFCSRPDYIRLFESVGVNLIELSGNHNNDWGRDAFDLSLKMFQERGWQWYAGGENAEKARAPLLIEHHGNRIALIGCNFAGPPWVWATWDEPGAAHCNLAWLDKELASLRAAGYLVIMTFQYNEIYQMKPSEGQVRDFCRAREAGATIVSGSQAHFPQTYEIQPGGLIHYGLGNLFFDQMDTPVDGTRRELLDLHVFYAGRHISTVVYTAMLEDFARPRPMTPSERAQFLQDLFRASGWIIH